MIERIVSGGQTGADRAGLDFAIANGIPHGGWCPKGRFAEDGTISRRYKLVETPDASYAQRTEWNVRDSDGTVVLSIAAEVFGGSKLTCDLAARYAKPCLHISKSRDGVQCSAEMLRAFVQSNHIRVLNIAGPRFSTEPKVGIFVRDVLALYLSGAGTR